MKKDKIISLLFSFFLLVLSSFYRSQCGLWDGVSPDGKPTGGPILCGGFPVPFLTSYSVNEMGRVDAPLAIVFNFIFYFITILIFRLFWKRIKSIRKK